MKFEWNIDPKVEKLVNVKLEYENVDYEVTGVLEPETLDVFEDVTYEFTGENGKGNIKITGGT